MVPTSAGRSEIVGGPELVLVLRATSDRGQRSHCLGGPACRLRAQTNSCFAISYVFRDVAKNHPFAGIRSAAIGPQFERLNSRTASLKAVALAVTDTASFVPTWAMSCLAPFGAQEAPGFSEWDRAPDWSVSRARQEAFRRKRARPKAPNAANAEPSSVKDVGSGVAIWLL